MNEIVKYALEHYSGSEQSKLQWGLEEIVSKYKNNRVESIEFEYSGKQFKNTVTVALIFQVPFEENHDYMHVEDHADLLSLGFIFINQISHDDYYTRVYEYVFYTNA